MAKKRKTPAQKRRARKKSKEQALKKQTGLRGSKDKKIKKRKKKSGKTNAIKKTSWIGKIMMYSFGFFLFIIGGGFVFQEQLLNIGFQEGKVHILEFAQKAGISISELDATELRIAGSEAITFGSFSTKLQLSKTKQLTLNLQESKASFNFKLNIFQLKGNQFHIEISNPEKEDAKPMVFKGTKLRLKAPIDRGNPQGSIQDIIKQFQQVLDEGKTPLDLSMKGTLSMEYNGQNQDVGIKTLQKEEFTFLQMEKESLLAIIGDTVDDLTDAEVQVLADYPLRAARLLRIQKYAKNQAANLSVLKKNFPEDAYRHVLWNYTLTKEFNAAFAEIVTDAHEIGAASNSEFDHKMDYNNNRLGRKYAQMGIKEPDLAQKVLTDPEIIRLTDE